MAMCMCYVSVYFMSFLSHSIFNALTQMTALCSKLYHRKDKYAINFALLTENGGMKGIAELKNEDMIKIIPRWNSAGFSTTFIH
jgi:hypothetical protein